MKNETPDASATGDRFRDSKDPRDMISFQNVSLEHDFSTGGGNPHFGHLQSRLGSDRGGD